MYLGKLVEIADFETIFEEPKHPYTQALISAIPEPDPVNNREEIVLKGDLLLNRPEYGCPFAPRCHAPKVHECDTIEPPLIDVGGNHMVACHLHPGK
jgi:peptide/nickel transport system ATP-binding protein